MTDGGGTPDETETPGLPPGTRLGKYEITRQLGAGGMGAVYEAKHTEIGKRVAIKVLSPTVAAIPGARARFLREAQLTSKIRHPNIVDVTDMGNEAGQTYIVMECLVGEDLSGRLERGRLSAAELADVMLPVCAAVVAAHHAGITHRDLKPQNIFLARGPHGVQPKVLDFGISKGGADTVGAGTLTGTGSIIGTPFYFAPEQIIDARAAGPRTDQYALGVIMYECLTGHRPYEADTLFIVFQAIVNGSPVPLRTHRPDLPPALEAIVLRAMNVDAQKRFSSTDELGRALLPFATARQRSIWEEAFDGNAPVDPNPPPRAPATLAGAAMTPMPPGLATPMPPGLATPMPPGLATPVPPGLATPVPPGATSAPGFRPSAALAAGDSFAVGPAPSGKGKWVAIGVAAVVAAAGGGWFALRGNAAPPAQVASPQPVPVHAPPPPAPSQAAEAKAPAPPPAAAVAPPPPAAPTPPAAAPTPPAEAAAERPAPSRSTHSSSHSRSRPKPAAQTAPHPREQGSNAAPVLD